jgi:chromosome segregation ATPase
MKQKKYFKNKIESVQKMIWDLEFKRFKIGELREEVRQEYDELKAKRSVLEAQIKSQKENPTKEAGEVAKLEDQLVLLNKDIEKSENDMKGLDLQVNGIRPCADYPEGVTGVNQQLGALRDLTPMIKSYIKTL